MSQPANIETTLTRAWLHRGPLACALWPVSLLFGALGAVRRGLYRANILTSARLPVPVVVVGNIFIGGTGKTPLTIWLVQALRAAGMRPGVISRGHGSADRSPRAVTASSTPQQVGDEPLLIFQHGGCPVMVGRDRAQAGRALLAAHPEVDVLVTDDGLQHYALQRDVEIVLFDGRGVGNGWLLPAGPLREPWPDRLQRGVRAGGRGIDLVLHTGEHAAFTGSSDFGSTRRLADHALRADGSRVALESLAGQPLLALAGIAKPEAFFAMLRDRGLVLAETRALPDHYTFDSYPRPQDKGYTVICTEKDAVKLFPRQADVLAVPLEFSPEPAFFTALDALLAPLLSPLPSTHGHQTA